MKCGCGKPLHYSDPAIEAEVQQLVDTLGERIEVRHPEGTWLVSRHYIALHGVRGVNLTEIAKRYGFERIA